MNIPDNFKNSLTGTEFENCKICERNLSNHGLNYIIEKAYRKFPDDMGQELLFEMAICTDCAQDMRQKLSLESRTAVQEFFYAKIKERNKGHLKPDELMTQCLLTGDPVDSFDHYHIYAHCHGHKISPLGGMYLIGGPVIEEIQNLLSAETRDELDRFADENLGGPPELRKLFSGGDLVGF